MQIYRFFNYIKLDFWYFFHHNFFSLFLSFFQNNNFSQNVLCLLSFSDSSNDFFILSWTMGLCFLICSFLPFSCSCNVLRLFLSDSLFFFFSILLRGLFFVSSVFFISYGLNCFDGLYCSNLWRWNIWKIFLLHPSFMTVKDVMSKNNKTFL